MCDVLRNFFSFFFNYSPALQGSNGQLAPYFKSLKTSASVSFLPSAILNSLPPPPPPLSQNRNSNGILRNFTIPVTMFFLSSITLLTLLSRHVSEGKIGFSCPPFSLPDHKLDFQLFRAFKHMAMDSYTIILQSLSPQNPKDLSCFQFLIIFSCSFYGYILLIYSYGREPRE